MSDQLAYTGNSLIIIRDFATKQILAEINKASYELEFLNSDTQARNARSVNLAAYQEFSPSAISVSGIILTQAIAKLLYNKSAIANMSIKTPVNEMQAISDTGSVYLTELPFDNNISYRINGTSEYKLVKKENIIIETGEIINLPIHSNIDFLYYTENKQAIQYTFDKKRLDYVSIEIINQGNAGRSGSKMYMKIDKASLSIRDSFNFDKMSIAQASLNFKIIDNTLEVFYY